MKTPVLTLIAAASLAACSQVPDPDYAAPTAEEAKAAYIAGQLADAAVLAGEPLSAPSRFPDESVRKVADTANAIGDLQTELTIESLRKTDAFDAVDVTGCEWQAIDPDLVDPMSHPRLPSDPMGAYFCSADVKVTQNYGIKAHAPAKGYFYRQDGEWIYAGEHAHGYERIDARPAVG